MTRIGLTLYVTILVGIISHSSSYGATHHGNCKFPFIYKKRSYTTCTTVDGDERPWCSTKVDKKCNHKFGHTEYCDTDYPGVKNEDIYISPGNNVGERNCGVPNKHKGYIGGEAEIAEYPWQVALLTSKDPASQFCGGTLVSDRHVVTAAKCTKRKSGRGLFVAIGDSNLAIKTEIISFVKEVINITEHHDYNSKTGENDIAVLEFAKPLNMTSHPNIKPICLPAHKVTYENKRAIVTGWGTAKSKNPSKARLHEGAVHILSKDNCGDMKAQMTNNMICAAIRGKENDHCHGDIGGPLIVQDQFNGQTLVGVVSGAFDCPASGKPWIFTEVLPFKTWIDKHTSNQNTSPSLAEHHVPLIPYTDDYPPTCSNPKHFLLEAAKNSNSKGYCGPLETPPMDFVEAEHCAGICAVRAACLFFNFNERNKSCTIYGIQEHHVGDADDWTIGYKFIDC